MRVFELISALKECDPNAYVAMTDPKHKGWVIEVKGAETRDEPASKGSKTRVRYVQIVPVNR